MSFVIFRLLSSPPLSALQTQMQNPVKLTMLVVDHTGEKLRVIAAELERVVGGAGLHVDSGASARARRVRSALRASKDQPVSKVIHCRV